MQRAFRRIKQSVFGTPKWVLDEIQQIKESNSTQLNLSVGYDSKKEKLAKFPDEIFQLQNLQTLNLGGNHLGSLPESISQLQNLQILNLEDNELSSLPESITQLQNLRSLILLDNQLSSLPESIPQLQNLQSLDLGWNKLSSLPESITQLQNLQSLILADNQLSSLPESITQLQNLQTLDLSRNGLSSLPESITQLQNLQTLDLSRIGLSSLPESITQLQNLQMLNLEDNELSSLPESIKQLQNLQSLILGWNRLSSLPENITELQNLQTLNLSVNGFSTLPESITQLQNLKSLNLGWNQLSTLPESITQLQNLQMLNLENNKLSSFPESIIQLQNLQELNLRGNGLSTLPENITQLQKLQELYLEENYMVSPPVGIAEKGIVSIREYFRQLEEEGEDYLFEAKLLILGEGGAGKTTLARKIENSEYKLQDEKSTEGVDVIQWGFPMDDGKSFHVNIWDFGGQEIYHATHQFFLTRSSLYALVADTRKEDTDFFYWLNVVDLLSENSPLLIVKNEKQDRHREINERQLRGQFNNLKEVLVTNLKTNRGLDHVVDEIKHYIMSLPHVGARLPRTWTYVREQLEKDKRNCISLDEYLNICKQNGFTDTKNSLQLSGYLHEIGVFLHFQDEPLLKKTVILKPKWGTDAVYKVLDNKGVIRNLGKFTRRDVDEIWSEPEYENVHDELLQLMMKFKLCYEIPTSKNTYIAPQLLTENQPEYEWDDEDNLLLRYTYEFMPKGILMQFIVTMNDNILEQKYIWKSGVILDVSNTLAEVIEYYDKREIHVRIAGAHKKELMTIVIHELDKIHDTYRRLKFDKLIPCNCTKCQNEKIPHFYRFDSLQKFVEDRQNQIQCQQSYKMVNVRGLIDDVFEKVVQREQDEKEGVQHHYHIDVEGDYIAGGKTMSDKKISIESSTIHGSVVAADSIQDSFNVIEKADIKDDLKEQLKQLNQAVEAMIKDMPEDEAKKAAKYMKKLAEEATEPSPDKEWYSVSIEGLIKAAENIGKVGEPVLELAGKVLKLLAGL